MDDLKRALDALTQIERETFQGNGEQPKRWNRLAMDAMESLLTMDAMESLHAARRAALAAAWVPCAEREPELSTDVLTWDGESMDVDYLVGPDYWKHRPTGVTHWMPLPPPPDEKAGEP